MRASPENPHEQPQDARFDDRFDGHLREWAARPPDTSPEAAARALTERLAASPERLPPWRWAAVPATLALVMGLWLVLTPPAVEPPAAAPGTTSVQSVPLGSEVVVISLDRETTLYLTLMPPLVSPMIEEGGTT